jgi:transposase
MALSPLEATITGLPNDLEACHALIRDLALLLESKDADITRLKERLQEQLRQTFGRSTEKLSPGQLSLFREELEKMLQESKSCGKEGLEASEKNTQPKAGSRHGGGGRNRISPTVPRVPEHHFPSDSELICSCGEQKKEIGTEKTEQVDYVPASFKVIEHVVHAFACKKCQEGVVGGKRPAQILSGGKATEGLIAQVSVAKYADHLPLHRQVQIYAREGVDLSSSSMGRWLDASAEAMKPIYERMHELILQSRVVQADESPVLFIDKKREAKKGKTGYVWVLYGDADHPYTYFDFQPDRCAERARAILKGFSGILLTDGYGGYEWYERLQSASCNVHNRRYFEKALKYDKKRAGTVLALYTELYKIEELNKGLDEEQILEVRQRESVPLMNQMKELLQSWQIVTPPKTPLGIAINYGLARWDKLCRFTEYGFIKLDTNLVENSIRPIAVGRKNWLQIGSEEALETASIHASLVNSCKRLGVNPYLYLRDVLIRLGQGNVVIDDLLPDRWENQNPLPQPESEANAEIKAVTVA